MTSPASRFASAAPLCAEGGYNTRALDALTELLLAETGSHDVGEPEFHVHTDERRAYEGIPLTQIAKEVGTSVRMIELHYAGVIANWDGKQVPAVDQIKAACRTRGRRMDVTTKPGRAPRPAKGLETA